MKSNIFYFSHDLNTRNDEKISNVLVKWGIAGYGLFWLIVEDLYSNNNRMSPNYESIAYKLRADVEMVRSILNDFDLFLFDSDGTFYSNSINRRISEINEKSEKARLKANKRWAKDATAMLQHTNDDAIASNSDANAMLSECNSNAIKEKKRKEKKVKENKINTNSEIELKLDIEDAIIVNHELVDWVNQNCIRVAKMKRPLTNEAAEKLCDEFGIQAVQEVILAMENWEPLHKKSIDTNLTCRNWLNRRNNAKPSNSNTSTANGNTISRSDGIKDWIERQRNNPLLFGRQDSNL